MSVRLNPMKVALAKGEIQIGTWVMLVRNPAILSLLHRAGMSFARLDMEHTPISIESVADAAMLARSLDFSLSVRVPVGNREWITRVLDAGVWNIYVPQVHTPEMAEAIVKAARHAPLGNRGTFEPGPQNDYTEPEDPTAKLEFLNKQVHVTVMLESSEAFRNLDDIVGMPGIDSVGIGPADLSQDLGLYGAPEEADVTYEYKKRLLEAALRHGKSFEIGAWSMAEAEHWIKMGAHVITFRTETDVLRSVYKEAVSAQSDERQRG